MKKLRIFAVIVLATMIMLFSTGCVVKMPVPEVTEGRFDFSVTYEVDGVEKTYSGVYICKYDGIEVTLVGSSRMWNGHIEGTDSWGIIEIQHTNEDAVIYIDFGFYPEYFMSDPDCIDQKPQPFLLVEHNNEETGEYTFHSDEKEIFEKFGVKIVGYNYAEPIENSYKDKLSYAYFEPSIN